MSLARVVGTVIRKASNVAIRFKPTTTRIASFTTPGRIISRWSADAASSSPAWSGKEHTDAGQVDPQADSIDADPEQNPTAKLDPLAFHPSGSNSEQIVAGERSKVDPLKDMRSGGSLRQRKGEKIEDEENQKSPSRHEKAPTLTDIDEADPTGP